MKPMQRSTIFRTRSGRYWNRIFRSRGRIGRRCERTTVYSSNAVFWILRTGAPWRDLPPESGRVEQHRTAVLSGGGMLEFGKSY